MNQELEFNGIEVAAGDRVNNHQRKLGLFKFSLLVAFCGSMAANVLFLSFFCIPIAIGWHFSLLWLCLAWAVLGAERFLIRTSAALSVWAAGAFPILCWVLAPESPLRELFNPHHGPSLLDGLFVASVPGYLTLWLFRTFRGSFVLRANRKSLAFCPSKTKMQLSVFELMCLTMLCCAMLLIAPAIVASALKFIGTKEYIWPGLATVGVVALFPLLSLIHI